MPWYDSAVFYHIYPLGLCGCPHENNGRPTPGAFDKLNEWAAWASQLGCTAIYIGPLFESGTHGYDTVDYRTVDRRLGTNEEFAAFVDGCHARGQKVIVDAVFNHVGRGFFAFQDLLAHREGSRWRDWFCDVYFGGNNEYGDGLSYANWGGHNLLVKLNVRNPEVQQYHFDTVRFWVEQFGIDGLRLDAADVLDMDFLKNLRAFTDTLKPEFWLMGEVIHGDYSRWLRYLHSVTDYAMHKALWSGHNDHNYFEIAHTLRREIDLYRGARLYTFSDNHDTDRLANKLKDPAHARHVAILDYTLWGVPSLYYGSEFGIRGQKSFGSDWPLRPALDLADYAGALESNPLTALYAALGRLRAEEPALAYGQQEALTLTTEHYAYARVLDGREIVSIFNTTRETRFELRLLVDAADGSPVDDLLAGCPGAEPVHAWIEGHQLVVDMPANYATVLALGATR